MLMAALGKTAAWNIPAGPAPQPAAPPGLDIPRAREMSEAPAAASSGSLEPNLPSAYAKHVKNTGRDLTRKMEKYFSVVAFAEKLRSRCEVFRNGEAKNPPQQATRAAAARPVSAVRSLGRRRAHGL